MVSFVVRKVVLLGWYAAIVAASAWFVTLPFEAAAQEIVDVRQDGNDPTKYRVVIKGPLGSTYDGASLYLDADACGSSLTVSWSGMETVDLGAETFIFVTVQLTGPIGETLEWNETDMTGWVINGGTSNGSANVYSILGQMALVADGWSDSMGPQHERWSNVVGSPTLPAGTYKVYANYVYAAGASGYADQITLDGTTFAVATKSSWDSADTYIGDFNNATPGLSAVWVKGPEFSGHFAVRTIRLEPTCAAITWTLYDAGTPVDTATSDDDPAELSVVCDATTGPSGSVPADPACSTGVSCEDSGAVESAVLESFTKVTDDHGTTWTFTINGTFVGGAPWCSPSTVTVRCCEIASAGTQLFDADGNPVGSGGAVECEIGVTSTSTPYPFIDELVADTPTATVTFPGGVGVLARTDEELSVLRAAMSGDLTGICSAAAADTNGGQCASCCCCSATEGLAETYLGSGIGQGALPVWADAWIDPDSPDALFDADLLRDVKGQATSSLPGRLDGLNDWDWTAVESWSFEWASLDPDGWLGMSPSFRMTLMSDLGHIDPTSTVGIAFAAAVAVLRGLLLVWATYSILERSWDTLLSY